MEETAGRMRGARYVVDPRSRRGHCELILLTQLANRCPAGREGRRREYPENPRRDVARGW